MSRLTDKDYWEELYQTAPTSVNSLPKSARKRLLKKLVGPRLMDLLSAYDDYLLWRGVFPRYLPAGGKGSSIVEIGSAPGDFMVRFAKTFGSQPFGVEYTSHGAELNRRTFATAGLDPQNVIEADFFSDEFLEANRDRFDIVISRGFIEHFDDVEEVISRHVALLRPGGLLMVLIPNLRGIYYWWTSIFNPGQLPLHNLDIMRLPRFRALFQGLPLEQLHCSYFGTFSFWLFTAPPEARWINRLIRLLLLAQRGLNLIFRLIFGGRGCESATLSPNLLFIGRKIDR
jgi:SAM-dependent methyltransferase